MGAVISESENAIEDELFQWLFKWLISSSLYALLEYIS